MKKIMDPKSGSILSKVIMVTLLTGLGIPCVVSAQKIAEENLGHYNLDEIIVTATATPVGSQMKTNAAVTIITREDIEARHYTNIVDVLESIPGVTTMTPANGIGFEVSAYAQPSIRGNATYAKIVCLIDGVKQDFGGRSYSANMIRNLADVERIEVLRGTNSVLYGPEAVGGVINIITRKHYDGIKTKLSTSFGNFRNRNFQIDNYGSSGKSFWSATVLTNHQGNYKDGRGRVRPQDADISEIDLKYGIHMNEQNDLILKFTKHSQNQDYVEGRGYGYDAPGHSKTPRYTTFTGIWDLHSKEPGKWSNTLSVYRGENKNDRWLESYQTAARTVASWSEKSTTRSVIIKDNYYNQLSANNRISAGFEYADRTLTQGTKFEIKEKSFYLQDEWDITKQLKFTVGGRYTSFEGMKSKFLPGVTLGYTFGDKAMMYVSSQGFMYYPSMTYIVGNGTTYLPSPGLKPYSGRTNEIGAKFKLDKSTYFDVAFYDRKQKDAITTRTIGTMRQAYNIDDPLHTKGIEVSLQKKFGEHVSLNLSYSHIKADKEVLLSNVAKDSFGIDLRYTEDKYNFGISGIGRRHIQRSSSVINQNMEIPCPSYWIWNVYGNYKANKNLKLWAKVNNIFDKWYIYTPDLDSTQLALEGYRDFRYYSKPGRSFMVGLEYTF